MLLSTVKRPTGATSNFHFIQQSHNLLAHPEDKALLESNLSAAEGKQTDGRG